MKALFVHSVRFVRTPDGKVFSEGQFSYEGWAPYLKHFDELTVIGRMSETNQAPAKWNLSSGPRVSFIGTTDDHGKPLMQLQNGANLQIIRKQLDNSDAVIVRQSKIGWLAAEEADKRGTPWAVEVVCDAWDAYWNYGTFVGKLYASVAELDSRRWIGKAGFAKYVTSKYLQKRYPCAGFFCGVSDVQIQPVSKDVLNKRITRWQNTNPDSSKDHVVIGLIGSLFNRYKGVDVALRALRNLSDEKLPIQFRILGNGHLDFYRKQAEQMGVGHLLHLDGSLPSGDPVIQWLDGLDIYVQPSLTEGLPRGLVEAMSRGLPALGSTCGGIPELLPTECLHRPGDDKTFANHLKRMVQNKSWRIEQAQRNFGEGQNFYTDRIEMRSDAFWARFVDDVKKRKHSSRGDK